MPSILQDWVMNLPIRHQGVLIAAVRGVDNFPKENSAKPIVRAIRGAFLHPADVRELDYPSAFMSLRVKDKDVEDFLADWDHYPIHFIQHLMHAAQVIGFKHTSLLTRVDFNHIYIEMVDKLHLIPETEAQMDERLTEDRIATYNTKRA